MALIILYDTHMKRDRIINTNNIFHVFEYEGGVRINYAQGTGGGSDSVRIAGTLEEFAKRMEAARIA